MPNVMVLGGRTFEKGLSHEGGVLLGEISDLIRDPTDLPGHSTV